MRVLVAQPIKFVCILLKKRVGQKRATKKVCTDLAGESGEERGKTKVGPKTVVRFEDGGEEEEKQLS